MSQEKRTLSANAVSQGSAQFAHLFSLISDFCFLGKATLHVWCFYSYWANTQAGCVCPTKGIFFCHVGHVTGIDEHLSIRALFIIKTYFWTTIDQEQTSNLEVVLSDSILFAIWQPYFRHQFFFVVAENKNQIYFFLNLYSTSLKRKLRTKLP